MLLKKYTGAGQRHKADYEEVIQTFPHFKRITCRNKEVGGGTCKEKEKPRCVCFQFTGVIGVIKRSVQKIVFYLSNQVITLSPKLLDASTEIKPFMKSDLQLPGSSKECQFNLCYLCES